MTQDFPITVHMIGQAHLDPVWLWPWTEGRAEALATSRSAVDRLREYPDFHFTRGESLVYEWIEHDDPALFDEIAVLIAEGRWHVVNGMVVQPDLNTPQGEAIVRQFLLGMAYFRDRFDLAPRVGYCVDTFGHPQAMPQILRGCGLDSYTFLRPGPHEKELPSAVFWWESADGSRVLAHRIVGAYTTNVEDHAKLIQNALDARPAELPAAMSFFGVGNHGGGPTKRQIENIRALAAQTDDAQIRFSYPDNYFDAIRDAAENLPVVADELQPHAVGCYSANSALKRAYRLAECRLLIAERIVGLSAAWLATPAPVEALRALWHDLCFVQFHDTLCGTTTKEGANDAIMALGRVALGAQELTHDAARRLGTTIDTAGPGGTVLLFNPAAEPYEGYVEYEPWTEWKPWSAGWRLTDESGAPVSHQLIETHEALSSPGHGPNRLVFPVALPPMGYRLYRFAYTETGNAPVNPVVAPEHPATAGPDFLANQHLHIRLDPETGDIVSCIRVEDGLEWVGPGGWNVPLVIKDESDTWSHGVRSFEDVIGRFGAADIRVMDTGPLQASVLIERTYEGNCWLQQIVLRRGEPELLIRNWLYWQGQWRMLKLAFDVAATAPRARHDVPFGFARRPCDGHEVPTQMWMDVGGEATSVAGDANDVGLAIINDGKYGCDVSGSMARLTVLRCPPYAYHQPHPAGSKARYDWLDQGLQEFSVVLRPHAGDWRGAGVVRRAREVNLPPVAVTMHSHAGTRLPADSLLRLDAPDLELTAFKPAENGEGFIVRIADRHGRGGAGELWWLESRFRVSLEPFEVRSYRLPPREQQGWRLTPCDMLERPVIATEAHNTNAD